MSLKVFLSTLIHDALFAGVWCDKGGVCWRHHTKMSLSQLVSMKFYYCPRAFWINFYRWLSLLALADQNTSAWWQVRWKVTHSLAPKRKNIEAYYPSVIQWSMASWPIGTTWKGFGSIFIPKNNYKRLLKRYAKRYWVVIIRTPNILSSWYLDSRALTLVMVKLWPC